MAQSEFKFNWIKRDDVANTTEVRFTVHVGEYRDIVEDGLAGTPTAVNRFVRDGQLETGTILFDGVLDDDEIRSYLRERLFTRHEAYPSIPEQAMQPGDARRRPRLV